MIGSSISHYRVLEKLGEGGMGVVYKTQDTHLDRFVALKVLPPEKVADAERKRRFVREAKAASALNHPNIVHVYDIDFQDGVDFIAMEYVAGKTLAESAGRKGLGVAEALNYAIQVADALAAAHAAGIVHRDLKPANVMVAENGVAKVLDFGLAKLMEDGAAGPPEVTRTLQSGTAEGVILGTVAYMSPEQAEGRKVDARSDIFSFGALLYEMITGRRAFDGGSPVSVLAAILHKEPAPMGAVVEGVPPELNKIVARCLRKNPEQRFQHMDDVKVLLRELQEEGGPAVQPEVSRASKRWPQFVAAAVLLLLGTALGLYLGGRKTVTTSELPPRKFQIGIQGDIRDIGYSDSPMGPAISPDGTMVAYTPDARLWVRDLNRLKPREIPDTQEAEAPFWSPDSEWVAYAARGVLKKVPARGGLSQTICDLPKSGNFLGGTWGTAGSIVFGISASGLFEVPAQGGEIKPFLLADRSKGEADFHSPHFLPDGRAVLYHLHPTSGYQFRLFVRSGQVARPVLGEAAGNVSDPVYSASGHLLYERVRGGKAVYAVPFSLSRLSASGEPFLVAEDAAKPSIAQDGTLVYQSAQPEELVMLDRSGKPEKGTSPIYEQIRFPAFSPDGSRIALMGVEEGNHDIWIHDLARGSKIRLTVDHQVHQSPAWSPSGEQIAYASVGNGSPAVFGKRSDGSGDAQPLVSGASYPEWSPDGKYLVYLKPAPKGGNDIWYLPLTGNGRPTPFLETPFGEANPKVSPDGRYIAYTSNESGRLEVYVKPFPQGEGRWLVSVKGGALPRWTRGGDELIYVEGGDTVMAVPLQTRPSFRAGVPEKLFDGSQAPIRLFSFIPTISAYDVSADGRHFATVRRVGGAGTYLTVVQNWLGDFQKK